MLKEEFLNELYIVKHHTASEKDQRIIQLAMDVMYHMGDYEVNEILKYFGNKPEYSESKERRPNE